MASTTAVSYVPPCEHLPAAFGLGRAPRCTGRGSDSHGKRNAPMACRCRATSRQPLLQLNRETSTERAYLGLPKLGPQQKGGDPVSPPNEQGRISPNDFAQRTQAGIVHERS